MLILYLFYLLSVLLDEGVSSSTYELTKIYVLLSYYFSHSVACKPFIVHKINSLFLLSFVFHLH